jgi:hypothetical protein
MKLLTIGSGDRGAIIADMLAKYGVKVNRVPLFKCYAVSNEVELLKSLKSIQEWKRFHIWGEILNSKDVRGIINTIFARYELFEGLLLTTSLEEEFGFLLSVELGKKLKEICEEPVLALGTLPPLSNHFELGELRERIKRLRRAVDVLILAEEGRNTNATILNSLNILAMIGEIDLKKKVVGEVVVDTSDILNSLKKDGVSVVGISKRKLPLGWNWLKKLIYGEEYEIKGLRTQRMIEMFREAVENLSVGVDLKTAKSALLVFSGRADQITMDGTFSCISMLEKMNPDLEIRYGDYPTRSNKLSAVVLFSGITSLKF